MAETKSTTDFAALLLERSKFTEALLAPLTRSGYGYDIAAFTRWCESHARSSLPATPETVGLYVVDQLHQGRKISTTCRRVAAIAHLHRAHKLATPVTDEVRDLLRGARRLRVEQLRQVRPLSIENLRQMSEQLIEDGSPFAVRSRAILLVGFASALRSANIVMLTMADVEFREQGALLRIRKEKQDQEGAGRLIGLPTGRRPETCPVAALRAWLAIRGDKAGPLFTRLHAKVKAQPLQAERITQIVKRCVKGIGLDPREYGAHSMRSGFCTAAGEAGVGELLIASQTGHRDMDTLRTYFRRSEVWRSNPCAKLDL